MEPIINKRLVIACAVGSVLEWFDYTLYGIFATTFAKLFFPPDGGEASSMMWSYLIFAFGFFSRPLGGIIFGYIGDRVSGRTALMTSILLMAIPTFVTGLLPTYESAGMLAPVLLAVVRLLQGIAIGGEFTGSMVYLVENAPAKKRGIFSCWSDFGSPCGVLLGLVVSGALTSYLSQDEFESFGWRGPFLFGIVIAFCGAYLRYGIEDTEKGRSKNANKMPLAEIVAKYKKTIAHVVLINAFGGCLFYTLNTYMHNHFKISGILSAGQAIWFTSAVSIMTTLSIPIGGLMSDKFGRKKIMVASIIGFLACVYPLFLTLEMEAVAAHLLFECAVGFCNGLFWGGRAAFYSETFPRRLRYTAVALAFGISHSLFAGTTPFISEFLVRQTGSCYSIAVFMTLLSVLALCSIRKLEDRTAQELL
jgi:MHS family proline/betaine transporter-like MFS transporter